MRQLVLSLSLVLFLSGPLLGASYQAASIVSVTPLVSSQQHEAMHNTMLDSGLITETNVVYKFKIRSGNELYVSEYLSPNQRLPKDLKRQIQIRVDKHHHLYIQRSNGSELMTKIVEHSVTPN